MISFLQQFLLFLPLIIGAYITFSLLKIPDLSIESAYVFGAAVGYLTVGIGLPPYLAIALHIGAAMAGGILVGLVSTTLNQWLNFPFLLAGILTLGLFHGGTQFVLGTSIQSFPSEFAEQTPEIFFLAATALMILLALFALFKTELGYSFAIFGNNPQFFSHFGQSTRLVVIVGICLADALAALSGYLFAQSNGFVDLTMGYGIVLLCLTALVLGKVFFRKQRPTILFPLVGAAGYFLLQQLLLRAGLNLKYFNSFQALLVMCVLVVKNHRRITRVGEKVDLLGV